MLADSGHGKGEIRIGSVFKQTVNTGLNRHSSEQFVKLICYVSLHGARSNVSPGQKLPIKSKSNRST